MVRNHFKGGTEVLYMRLIFTGRNNMNYKLAFSWWFK